MKDRYTLRGLDRVPIPDLEDAIVGQVDDFETALKATKDMDVVIHLAGVPSGAAPWEDILQNNIIGTYNIFEGARRNGVRRIVLASRAGLFGPYPKNMMRTADMLPRPESYYSVSKIFGESLGYMYSARHGMEFVGVRIGNFKRAKPIAEHPHRLSHGDCVRLFEAAATHPGVKYEVVFGVSDSTWKLYDVEHGRKAIGYYPQDKSVIEPEV